MMKAKRLAALILCLALILPLAPTAALADDPEFWVGYTAITTSADASGEGWVWTASAKTLALTDAAIRGADKTSYLTSASAVCLPGGSTVVLAGDNTLLGGTSSGTLFGSAGLFGKGALTVTGSGSLTAVGGEIKERNSKGRCGIYASGDITFDSGFTGSVLAVGGDGAESGGTSFGIYADKDIDIANSGKLTIAGTGSLAAVGGRSGSLTVRGSSYGIKCNSLSITAAANVTAVGGQVLGPYQQSAFSYGISVDTMLQVSAAAHVTAVGGQAEVEVISVNQSMDAFSQGIFFAAANNPSEMTLSDNANVTAIGGKSAKSYGILADGIGSLTIDGGAVLTAVGGDVSDTQSAASYGLLLVSLPSLQNHIDVTVTSGALVAKSGNTTNSYGLYFGTWNGGTAELSLGTGTGDAVIVAHAGNGGRAVADFTTPSTALVGGNAGQYVVYGKGVYTDKNAQDELTHVFATAQDAAIQSAVPATPFVIIDGGNTGTGLTFSIDQTLDLSGTSVVVAGNVDSADTVSTGFRSFNTLTIEGSGALVCLGGTSAEGPSYGASLIDLTIGSACSLVAVGSSAGGSSNHSMGLFIVNNGLTSAGYLTAVGGAAQGLMSQGANIAGPTTLTAGGLSAVGGVSSLNDYSEGLTTESLTLSGASVTAMGGCTGGLSNGVRVRSASITGGSLRAVGGSGSASAGLRSTGAVTVGGSVACMGGHGSNSSYGAVIDAALSAPLTVGDNGGLCAVGGTAQGTGSATSAGLRLYNTASSAVSGAGVLTAFGGQAKLSSGTVADSFGLVLENASPLTLNGSYVTLSGNNACAAYMTNSESVVLGPGVRVKTGDAATGEGAALLPATALHTVYPTYKYLRTLLALTISGTTVSDKPYDGTNTAICTPGQLNGALAGDDVTVTPTGTYADANVGTGKNVPTTYALSGRDAYKYAPPTDETLQGTITPRALTVTPNDGQSKLQGAPDPAFTYQVGNTLPGETPAFAGALSRVSGELMGTYAFIPGTLALADNGSFKAGNYTFGITGGKVFTVMGVSLVITPYGCTKYPIGGATGNAAFRITATGAELNAANYKSATLDGQPLDLGTPGHPGADGSVENGSIQVSINPTKLNTLTVGTHTLIVTLQGSAFAGRTVAGTLTVTPPPVVPKTGDDMPLLGLSLLAVLSCCGIALLVFFRRRSRI